MKTVAFITKIHEQHEILMYDGAWRQALGSEKKIWSRRHWSFEIIKSNKLGWRFFRFPYPVRLVDIVVVFVVVFSVYGGCSVVHKNQWNWNLSSEDWLFFENRSSNIFVSWQKIVRFFPQLLWLKRFQKFGRVLEITWR